MTWREGLARLHRLWRAEEAVAAVEFALILPVMLMVYVGTMEASALISMDRKVQSVTGAVGDLVARSNGEITVATMTDYFQATSGMMTPYSPAKLRQVVTQVAVDADGAVEVDWSREYTNGTLAESAEHQQGDSFVLPQEMRDIALGNYVIVSETYYSYTPFYGIVFDEEVHLYRENFYLPRFGERITIKP